MNADIKLDGAELTLEGDAVKTVAPDFKLDSPSRRNPARNGEHPHRRALVHAPDDSLFINYAGDFSAVGIEGTVSVHGNLVVGKALIVEGPDGSLFLDQASLKSLLADVQSLKDRVLQLESELP